MEASTRDIPPADADRELIRNVSTLLARTMFGRRAGTQFKGAREMWDALGYRDNPTTDDYIAFYERDPLAGTTVDAMPTVTWRRAPEVIDGDGTQEETEFEKDFKALSKRLRLWSYFERVDKLAGVSNYAVLLIGSIRSGGKLDKPLSDDNIQGPDDIGYLSVFRQDHADIKTFEDDRSNERFGRPKLYQLQMLTRAKTVSGSLSNIPAHHSRVVHVAENLSEDEVFGRPRLQRVLNLLDDTLKIGGGSAEMFWQNVAGLLHGDIPADADVDEDTLKALAEKIEDAQDGLRRNLLTRSLDLNRVAADAPDPRGIWTVIKELYAAGAQTPKRIIFGSERGELSSSQDISEFLGRMSARQINYAEPVLIRPFIDRLIEAEALTKPKTGDYTIVWPDLRQLSDKEVSEVMANKGRAVSDVMDARAAGGLLTDGELRTFLGLPEEIPPETAISPEDDAFGREEDGADASSIEGDGEEGE